MKIILSKTDLSYPIEESMVDFSNLKWYDFFKSSVRVAINDSEEVIYEYEDGRKLKLTI